MNINHSIRDHLRFAAEHLREERRRRETYSLAGRLWCIQRAMYHLQIAERGIEWKGRGRA